MDVVMSQTQPALIAVPAASSFLVGLLLGLLVNGGIERWRKRRAGSMEQRLTFVSSLQPNPAMTRDQRRSLAQPIALLPADMERLQASVLGAQNESGATLISGDDDSFGVPKFKAEDGGSRRGGSKNDLYTEAPQKLADDDAVKSMGCKQVAATPIRQRPSSNARPYPGVTVVHQRGAIRRSPSNPELLVRQLLDKCMQEKTPARQTTVTSYGGSPDAWEDPHDRRRSLRQQVTTTFPAAGALPSGSARRRSEPRATRGGTRPSAEEAGVYRYEPDMLNNPCYDGVAQPGRGRTPPSARNSWICSPPVSNQSSLEDIEIYLGKPAAVNPNYDGLRTSHSYHGRRQSPPKMASIPSSSFETIDMLLSEPDTPNPSYVGLLQTSGSSAGTISPSYSGLLQTSGSDTASASSMDPISVTSEAGRVTVFLSRPSESAPNYENAPSGRNTELAGSTSLSSLSPVPHQQTGTDSGYSSMSRHGSLLSVSGSSLSAAQNGYEPGQTSTPKHGALDRQRSPSRGTAAATTISLSPRPARRGILPSCESFVSSRSFA